MDIRIFQIVQIVLAILLMVTILLQSRGSGISSAFGASGGEYFRVRRGFEKLIFYSSIVISILFVANILLIALLIK